MAFFIEDSYITFVTKIHTDRHVLSEINKNNAFSYKYSQQR